MASELQRATDMFTSMVQAVMAGQRPFHQTLQQQPQPQPQQHIQQPQPHQLQQQQTTNNNLLTPSNAINPAPDMSHSRPPVPQQQQISNPLLQQQQRPQDQQQPQNLSSSLRPPVQAPPIKVQRKPQQSSSTASASTPSPAAAATPVASALTPTAAASSPPVLKSPKGKASGKPKATIGPNKRRVSKVVPPPVSAEPVQSSPSTSNRNTKRPHDDNTSNGAGPASGSSSTVANEPSPPKRIKTEWDSAPSEALRKKSETIDSIKTEEDANVFLEQMTAELIKMAGEGQPSFSSDISDTLEMILKGYGPIPDISGAMSLGESSTAREPSSPPAPLMESFDEFFDFSFGTVDDDENNSKAPTPDLVSSSSTNPSPESNHEVDAANHGMASSSSSAMEIKPEEQPDHLRLATWKEIDHGEATYYNPTTEWKWDSPMPSHDQPWAIFNS